MSQITIDRNRCSRCGLCARVCTRGCLVMEKGEPIFTRAERCIACGHCLAICPREGALVHAGLTAETWLHPAEENSLPERGQLAQLLCHRRSVRHYRAKAVPAGTVQELLNLASFAPTAKNRQEVCLIVVDRPDQIAALSAATVRYYGSLQRLLGRRGHPAAANPTKGMPLPEKAEPPLHGVLFERHAAGEDPIFYGAPLLIVPYGPKRDLFSKDDSLFALYNMILGAELAGLGSCLIGYFVAAANRSTEIRHTLGLGRGEEVQAACVFGYRQYRFHRPVPRRPVQQRGLPGV